MDANGKSPQNVFAGLLFAGVAMPYALNLTELPVGTAFRMRLSYFPLLLVIPLAMLGAILFVRRPRVEGEPIGSFDGSAEAAKGIDEPIG